jgi:hypothetical protein
MTSGITLRCPRCSPIARAKQVWDNTGIASPWLNVMRNSLNTQVWSFTTLQLPTHLHRRLMTPRFVIWWSAKLPRSDACALADRINAHQINLKRSFIEGTIYRFAVVSHSVGFPIGTAYVSVHWLGRATTDVDEIKAAIGIISRDPHGTQSSQTNGTQKVASQAQT